MWDKKSYKLTLGRKIQVYLRAYLHSNDRRKKHAIEKLAGDFGRYMPTETEEPLEKINPNATIQ
jgi:hypothetical protein